MPSISSIHSCRQSIRKKSPTVAKQLALQFTHLAKGSLVTFIISLQWPLFRRAVWWQVYAEVTIIRKQHRRPMSWWRMQCPRSTHVSEKDRRTCCILPKSSRRVRALHLPYGSFWLKIFVNIVYLVIINFLWYKFEIGQWLDSAMCIRSEFITETNSWLCWIRC